MSEIINGIKQPVNVGDRYVKATWFETAGSGTTSGTITKPASAGVDVSFVMDEWGTDTDALVSTMANGKPTFESPVDAGGNTITVTFNEAGEFAFSGTPDPAGDHAVIFVYKCYLKNFDADESLFESEMIDNIPLHAASHVDGTDDIQNATAGQKGLATAAQITSLEANVSKLGGIEAGATKYPDTGEQAFLDADHDKLDGIEATADITDAVNVASSIHGVAGKATPVDADEVGLIDSAAANVLKVLTWANIKATLKAYLDTLYTKYPGAGEQAFLDADHSKLDAIEALADVTSTHETSHADVLVDGDIGGVVAAALGADDNYVTDAEKAALHTQGTDTALGAVGTKNPPIDADKVLYRDSVNSDVLVTSTWTQIKAFLKTYFDSLYQAVSTAVLLATLTTKGDIFAASGESTPIRLGIGTDDHVLTAASGETTGMKWAEAAGGDSADYVKVSDVKAYNVHGGTFTLGAWRTRDINTEDSDASAICSIASNQITLAAGTYICSIQCAGFAIDKHVARLYNITDSSETLQGMLLFSDQTYFASSLALIKGKFTIAAQKTFEIQHYCTVTQVNSGFGLKTDVSGIDSVYTTAEFWRVAT